MSPRRRQAWVCTGCLATWLFQNGEEAVEAEGASHLHRCHVEGSALLIVDAEGDVLQRLIERFGRKPRA